MQVSLQCREFFLRDMRAAIFQLPQQVLQPFVNSHYLVCCKIQFSSDIGPGQQDGKFRLWQLGELPQVGVMAWAVWYTRRKFLRQSTESGQATTAHGQSKAECKHGSLLSRVSDIQKNSSM